MPATFTTREVIFHFRYGIGETVYHRLADEESPGMVTGLFAGPTGVHYRVTWGFDLGERMHCECELSSEYVPCYPANGKDDL